MIPIATAYYVTMLHISGKCTHSRDWRTPPDAPYQERPGGRHAKHPCLLCYHILFSVLPFVLFDICRTEDHKPRGRASDVSTLSTCFFFLYVIIYCPLPHPISVRTDCGYHCRVLVWLLALFAKLNRFFRKKHVLLGIKVKLTPCN